MFGCLGSFAFGNVFGCAVVAHYLLPCRIPLRLAHNMQPARLATPGNDAVLAFNRLAQERLGNVLLHQWSIIRVIKIEDAADLGPVTACEAPVGIIGRLLCGEDPSGKWSV